MASTKLEDAFRAVKDDPQAVSSLELDEEELMALGNMLNPYSKILGPGVGDKKHTKSIATTFTNMREDYYMRFVTTSMSGFLFRMHDEHAPEENVRRFTPKSAKSKAKKAEKQPFTVEEMRTQVDALNDLVTLAEEAQKELAEAEKDAAAYDKAEMVFSETEMQEAVKFMESEATDDAEPEQAKVAGKMKTMQEKMVKVIHSRDKLAGMKWAVTINARNLGIQSDFRYDATEAAALKFPNSAEVIKNSPDRFKGLLPAGEQQVPVEVAKKIIKTFLCSLFEYNPDAHVRGAADELRTGGAEVVEQDPDRISFKDLMRGGKIEPAPEDTELVSCLTSESEIQTEARYKTACHILQDARVAKFAALLSEGQGTAEQIAREERLRKTLMPRIVKKEMKRYPPQDTFHRFRYYTDVNMVALREATNSLYVEKPWLDFAIAAWDVFEGTEKEVKKAQQRFREQYQDQVCGDIVCLKPGAWTFLGAGFEKNREAIDISNSKTTILKAILDRGEEDKKMGELLMRDRVTRKKAENIRKDGPDAPGLSAYKQNNPMGGVGEAISAEDKLRLERAKGDVKAARELKYIDEQREIAHSLERKARLEELTPEEKLRLKDTLKEIERAQEMLAVPDDAIQVDMWVTDAKKGTMTKKHFYSKSKAPNNHSKEELAAIHENLVDEEELNVWPEASRKRLIEARKEGKDQPELAPFAKDYLAQEIEAERKAADKEALEEVESAD